MQQHYGIDLSAPGLLEGRSGRWLSARILGLFTIEHSRLRSKLFPESVPGGGEEP